MAACGHAPLSEVFYLAVGATGNNGVVALKLQRSVLVVNNMSLAVKALAGIKTRGQFKNSHGTNLHILGRCPYLMIQEYHTIS